MRISTLLKGLGFILFALGAVVGYATHHPSGYLASVLAYTVGCFVGSCSYTNAATGKKTRL
jgi:hypothetical protein